MVNHINKYASAQAIQDALDNGTLANPYVAMTTAGTLDYNTLEPTPPAPATMGTWSDDGQGVYTFQITETDTSYWVWAEGVQIAQLYGVIYDGGNTDMDVKLAYNENGFWTVDFTDGGSDHPTSGELFQVDGEPQTWESGVQGAEGDSDSYIMVEWDGSGSFTFYSSSSENPISIGTINPPYPAGE